MNQITCPKCQGKGILPNYKHVEDGICFLCYGSGSVTQEEYESYQLEGIKADNRRAKKMKAIENQRKQWEGDKKEKAIQRKAQKEQEEKEKKERDEYNRNHPVQETESERAFDDFWKYMEGEE
jgi:hypothetical protein